MMIAIVTMQGLLFWLFQGGLRVSPGTVEWYRSSCGTDFDFDFDDNF